MKEINIKKEDLAEIKKELETLTFERDKILNDYQKELEVETVKELSEELKKSL